MRQQQLNLAYLSWSQGKTTQAENIVQHLLEQDPQDADALHFMGVMACQQGNHPRAHRLVSQALELKPQAPQFWNSLGNVLRDSGQLPQALDAYQQAIAFQPNYSNAHYNLAGVQYLQGDKIQAEKNYRKSLTLNPDVPEAHYNLANLLKENQQWAESRHHYQQALTLRPQFAEAWNNLGLVHQHQGEWAQARHCYQKSLEQNPSLWETYYNLGQVCEEQSDWAGANQAYQTLLRQQPSSGRLWNQMGNLYYRQGQTAMARTYYEQAVQLDPQLPEAQHNLGNLLVNAGEAEKALPHYQQALALKPNSVETWNNLGNLYQHLHRSAEAIQAYEQAIRLQPEHAATYNNLGALLEEMDRQNEALGCYRRGLEFNPQLPELHGNLANLLVKAVFYDEAIAHYQKVIALKPDFFTAWNSLATTQMEDGQIAAALATFQQMAQLQPDNPLWRLRADPAFLCSPFMADKTAIDQWYQDFFALLERQMPLDLDPYAEELISSGLPPCGFTFYHGNPQRFRQLRAGYARLFFSSSGQSWQFPPNPKPRVGLLVTPRHEKSFASAMQTFINGFAESDFELWLVCAPESRYRLERQLNNPMLRWLPLNTRIDQAVTTLRQANLDLLHYWEIGSDALNYFLPFFRPAPIQTTSLGLPITSGIPTVTAFLSSQMAEPPGAENHYSEQLIPMQHLPLYLPAIPKLPPLSRADFGLSETERVYICPQNLLKIQPEFDLILGDILAQDPAGTILLFQRSEGQNALLKARFRQTIGPHADRIQWLGYQPFERYLRLLQLADVVLDTTPVGGGLTTLNALAVGTPVVTLTGDWLWGRMSTACYQWLGINDCVTTTPESYVAQALRLANNRNYQQFLREAINAAWPKLQQHLQGSTELIDVWRQLLKQHGRV